jgi:hypothetical protein
MDFFRVAAAFGTVFALLGVLYYVSNRARATLSAKAFTGRQIWSRRIRPAAPGKSDSLKVLKRVALTPTHQLHLIETIEGAFLICTHPQGCTLLPDALSRTSGNREHLVSQSLGRYAS